MLHRGVIVLYISRRIGAQEADSEWQSMPRRIGLYVASRRGIYV